MLIKRFLDFWRTGNIRNSPNFPRCDVKIKPGVNLRLLISNRSVPGVINGFTDVIKERGCNISGFFYAEDSQGKWAYNVVDINNSRDNPAEVTAAIAKVPDVTKVRVIAL